METINGFNWVRCEAMKYWTFSSTYAKTHDTRAEAKNMIFSGDYTGALKVDGFYQRFVKDDEGNCLLIARNPDVKGEPVNKIEWAPQLGDFWDSLPNGTCLLGEIYLPGNEGSRNVTTILGCLKEKAIARQEKSEKLHYYVFDVCAWNGQNLINVPIKERIKYLENVRPLTNEYVEVATYLWGEELWEAIGEYLASGREGVVITRKDCPIYFKRTPARQSLKIKRELSNTIDCFFTGNYAPATKEYNGKEIEKWRYWENIVTGEKIYDDSSCVPTVTYGRYVKGETLTPISKGYFNGWAASLEVGVYNPETKKGHPIGWLSNLPEEIKSNPGRFVNRPFELTAMEINDTAASGLRHAKFVQWRDDLTLKDCSLDKVK